MGHENNGKVSNDYVLLKSKISRSKIKFRKKDYDFTQVRFSQFESPFEQKTVDVNFIVSSNTLCS